MALWTATMKEINFFTKWYVCSSATLKYVSMEICPFSGDFPVKPPELWRTRNEEDGGPRAKQVGDGGTLQGAGWSGMGARDGNTEIPNHKLRSTPQRGGTGCEENWVGID